MSTALVNPLGVNVPQLGLEQENYVAPAKVAQSRPIGHEDFDARILVQAPPVHGVDLGSTLSRAFGVGVTAASPVWGAQALDCMRSLQRTLLQHSMTAQGDSRNECLLAVQMVEQSVQWRMRLLQMREMLEPEA